MTKKRILLIEDEAELIRAIKIRLEAAGFETISAKDGEEGLETARKEKPDLIVLDLILPNMSGFDVCRKLKIDKEYKDIPIIMLTAKSETRSIFEAAGLSATDYVIKPFSLENLFSLICRYLDDDKRQPIKV